MKVWETARLSWFKRVWRVWIWVGLVVLFWGPLAGMNGAAAGTLQARLEHFPWHSAPDLPPAQGDLYYPAWFSGQWQVTSTLMDAVAPLAPELVSPGFESSRAQLGQAVTFSVCFKPGALPVKRLQSPLLIPQVLAQGPGQETIADRIYNATQLTEALMGKQVLASIQLDQQSPNRQLTQFQNGQLLITQISNRLTETRSANQFITSELYQQEFRGQGQIYFNQVENTVAYQKVASNPHHIEAEQVTAIYLSPQDPDYFAARQQPVALYRYQMRFEPVKLQSN